MGFSDLFRRGPSPSDLQAKGKRLASLAMMLCRKDNLDRVLPTMHLSPADYLRLQFYLTIMNYAHIIYMLNAAELEGRETILDSVSKEIASQLAKLQNNIHASDLVQGEATKRFLCDNTSIGPKTKTSVYTLFLELHDFLLERYVQAVAQQMELMLSMQCGAVQSAFLSDPLLKTFFEDVSGSEPASNMGFYVSLSGPVNNMSAILMSGAQDIVTGKL